MDILEVELWSGGRIFDRDRQIQIHVQDILLIDLPGYTGAEIERRLARIGDTDAIGAIIGKLLHPKPIETGADGDEKTRSLGSREIAESNTCSCRPSR
jgi:hypothetical protein